MSVWRQFVLLRGVNWVHFTHRAVYFYIEFKLSYLKNQSAPISLSYLHFKSSSIRIKELFEPMIFAKKKKQNKTKQNKTKMKQKQKHRRVIALLKTFSGENDL